MNIKTKEQNSTILFTLPINLKDIGKVSAFSPVKEWGLIQVCQDLKEQSDSSRLEDLGTSGQQTAVSQGRSSCSEEAGERCDNWDVGLYGGTRLSSLFSMSYLHSLFSMRGVR